MKWYCMRRMVLVIFVLFALAAIEAFASELTTYRNNAAVLRLNRMGNRAYQAGQSHEGNRIAGHSNKNSLYGTYKYTNSFFRSDQLYNRPERKSGSVNTDRLDEAIMTGGMLFGPRQVMTAPGLQPTGGDIVGLPSPETSSTTTTYEPTNPLGYLKHPQASVQQKPPTAGDVEKAKLAVKTAVEDYKQKVLLSVESADSADRLAGLKKAYFNLTKVMENNNQFNEIQQLRKPATDLALDVQSGSLAGSSMGDASWKESLSKRIDQLKESLKPESKRSRAHRGPVAGK